MIIFLYGTDGYRLFQNKNTVIASYKAKHSSGLNFRIIDGASLQTLDILTEIVKSTSFFKEVKLVVLKNCFAGKQSEKILELLKQYRVATDKDCVLLAIHTGPESEAKPKELFAFLSDKNNLVRSFKPLEGSQRTSWLKKEAIMRGTPFEAPALKKFTDLVGGPPAGGSWQAMNELDKLSSYCRGPITTTTVDLLVRAGIEPNIFAFIDALGTRNGMKAADLLFQELKYGRDPYYLLTMITYQFRNMLIVKDLLERGRPIPLIAKEAGLHPFVARKMASTAGRFDKDELRSLYKEILQLDIMAKSGTADLEDSLFHLVLNA